MSITFGTFAAYGRPLLADEVIEQLRFHTASIRRSHGQTTPLVLLTDEVLADPRALDLFTVVRRRPVAGQTLLLDRSRHYRAYLDSHDWNSHICFLDFDILVMKDLHPAYTGTADAYLTLRAWSKDMPINGGVVFLEQGSGELCKRFYDDVLTRYAEVNPEHVSWFGDQLALKWAASKDAVFLDGELVQTRSGARLGFVARALYNFTPYDVDSGLEVPAEPSPSDVENFKDRPILHFKGPRKHLMRAVALASGL